MSVREGLLSLLSEGPSYGFQLKTRFEAATGGTWPLNVGQVYTTLDRLERDGLVIVEEDDGQKIYRLTDTGHHELDAWWEAVPGDEPPPRDALLIKLLLALPFGRDHALDVLSRQRAALVHLLQTHRRRAAASNGDGVDGRASGNDRPSSSEVFAASLVADAVLMRVEADLRWLDRCEARIAAAPDADLAAPHTAPLGDGSTDEPAMAVGADPLSRPDVPAASGTPSTSRRMASARTRRKNR